MMGFHRTGATLGAFFVAFNVIASCGGQVQAQQGDCARGVPCISIYECPHLLRLLKSKFITQSIVATLRQAQCDPQQIGQKSSFVCCEVLPTVDNRSPINPSSKEVHPKQIKEPSLGLGDIIPDNDECGIESTTRKIFGGVAVELDEFPWMAILEYEKHDGSWSLECGGSLINKRYVLTAAHCVTGKQVSNLGRLINVRLGEYNTETDEDCVQFDNADQECADPVQNYAVEEIILHEKYLPSDASFYQRENDIALIRLSGNAKYSEFVAPICLPSTGFAGTPANKKYIIAGWGRTLVSKRSSIKLKVSIPPYDFEACQKIFATRRVDLTSSQLCAGGNYAKDSCNGDSGGPLMSRENGAWIAEGIVSFGLGCGLERPAVYTKVQSFLPWIRSKLKP